MSLIEVVILALVLAVDAFSVGAVVGMTACGPRQVFRLSFHFGLFQAGMPLVGSLAGFFLHGLVSTYGPWVAFGLLAAIGSKMVVASLWSRSDADVCRPGDPTRGLRLIGLSLAVSIDAFGAGVSMGLTMELLELAWAVGLIGLIAAGATWLAMRLGQAFVCRVGRRMETVAGLVLVALGVRMLVV
jgi:putative Mn2+ efflux pump MntP